MLDMRKPRELQQGATYHVSARSNRQEFILESKTLKDMLLRILKRAKEKYQFKLKHYCIMSNHIHLLIEPKWKEDLPRIMQWILSRFASQFNRHFNLFGHVWWDRYRSNIVRTIRRLCETFHYISQNPVKAGIVQSADSYEYSGLYYYKRKLYGFIEPPGPDLLTEAQLLGI